VTLTIDVPSLDASSPPSFRIDGFHPHLVVVEVSQLGLARRDRALGVAQEEEERVVAARGARHGAALAVRPAAAELAPRLDVAVRHELPAVGGALLFGNGLVELGDAAGAGGAAGRRLARRGRGCAAAEPLELAD
jgi:hypothetical protein